MTRFVITFLLCCLPGCAVMHTVTGDAMFAPNEAKPAAPRMNVPEPEPVEPPAEPMVEVQSGPRLDDDELAPLPRTSQPVKKKSTNVAKR